MDIVKVLEGLSESVDKTTLSRLIRIVGAMLSMTGRVTMLGLSRWSEEGCGYKTIQRFFKTTIVWSKVNWTVIRPHLLEAGEELIIGGDESVVTKSGKQTYGLDRFFSSLYGKPVPGLAFFSLSLISVKDRISHPVLTEQVIKPEAEPKSKSKSKSSQKKPKRNRGRPKGSKNKNRREVELSPYLSHIQQMLQTLLAVIGQEVKVIYCVMDGAFGHNNALQMVGQCFLHLVSKLQHNAALYFPYEGPQNKRGAKKKYGDKLDYQHLPEQHLKEITYEDDIQTKTYQMPMWHKLFPDQLNIVIIRKLNLKTGAYAHVVLFSSDLTLSFDKLIDFYRLRFQIEFNFRDAKQFWGLEDFMNVNPTPVYNAANLAMFMVNVSHALIKLFHADDPAFSIIDLKALFRGRKYVSETLKLLPELPDPIFIDLIFQKVPLLGRVNST